ncbi:mesothelin-like protein [Cinclus cinclus]|uniref:mesothelin-like protein n=1 Tax=Cinclus cinclus TaxID=127875 RepID=UPI002E13A61A
MTPHVYRLGVLLCDLEPGTMASDPNILDKLKRCPALTGAQQDALNALLLSGHTEHGDPSSWDLQTLQDLGPLVLALNQSTLSLVAEAAREDFRSIAATSIIQGHSQRDKSLLPLVAGTASRPRLKRSSDRCQSEPITASNIPDILTLSLDQLDPCLSNDVLIENLEAVLEQPITSEISQILKKKVDEVFHSEIPEEQLRRLGELSHLYTEQEISQWSVTSSDTLSALLSASGRQWNDSQVLQLLSRYLALKGSLTGPLLQKTGGKLLCKLQEEQIQQIPAAAIGTAGYLNISTCSQTKKEQLYGKAREAFASLTSSPSSYYCWIQPYLGGAPAEDLKELANAGVAINMDLDTFLALNPEELQKLSVTDVKHLLGKNLPVLKKAELEPSVMSWVQKQFQQELDCVLGIGLQGGRPEPTPTVPTTSASVTSITPVSTPIAISSHSTPQPSTVPPRTPTLSTQTGRATSPTVPLLSTLLATSSPSATPVPAVTSRATTGAGTNLAAATTTPHTPTPIPNSTISTQKPLSSSTAKPVPEPCQPSSPPGSPKPKTTPGSVPETPRPTSNGYINLQPEPGSGCRLCSCLVPVLAATTMNVLLL